MLLVLFSGLSRMDSRRHPVSWQETQTSQRIQAADVPNHVAGPVYLGAELVIENGDEVGIEDFVIFERGDRPPCIGQILEIVIPSSWWRSTAVSGATQSTEVFTLLRRYSTGEAVRPYSMPKIRGTEEYCLLRTPVRPSNLSSLSCAHLLVFQHLLCSVNVQHNCAANKCNLSSTRAVFLEREDSGKQEPVVHHRNPEDRVLNTSKLRDAQFIQKFVFQPPELNRVDVIHDAVDRFMHSS